MKALLIITCTFLSFTYLSPAIKKCYLSFKPVKALKAGEVERFPSSQIRSKQLTTANGTRTVSVTDGARVLYYNANGSAFVNLIAEVSNPANYAVDTVSVLDNMNYLSLEGREMESKELLKLSFNGKTIYGFCRNNIETGSTLGNFVMFTANNTIVYFRFNNIGPALRNYNSIEEWLKLRDTFLSEYTAHLKSCKG